jgi:hypothetical protein
MTIDTSREAVERLLDGVTPGPWEYIIGHSDWGLPRSNAVVPAGMSEFDFDAMIAEVHSTTPYCAGSSRKDREISATADANARFIAASRDLVPALLAERDAALAEVARLSAPPDDAEVAALTDALGVKSAMIQLGEKIAWGSETALMDQAADALTRLSHTLAAETAKREAMEVALRTVETDLAEAEDKFHIASFYISDEQTKTCVMDRVKWMAKAGSRVRATLAQHGKVK